MLGTSTSNSVWGDFDSQASGPAAQFNVKPRLHQLNENKHGKWKKPPFLFPLPTPLAMAVHKESNP